MIADPIATRISNINGTTLTDDNVNIDMIGFGPGSKTTRKLDPTSNVNTSLVQDVRCSIEHTVTKSARRRSVIRFDVTSVVDSSLLKVHTASAYLVVDQPDVYSGDSGLDAATTDTAVSALLSALITSRAGGASIVESAALNDFLNGEP